MKELIDGIPGKGSRTYISVAVLVAILVAQQFNFVVDQFDQNLVESIKTVLAGLSAVFFKAGVSK